jgi:predicted O-linked N-acetylglucosamine transferase (SPINDLY family)
VTYIGYQNTTGMAAMDYRLTDEYSDPSGTTDAFYTEKLVRLPRSFFCYRPSDDAPPVGALPLTANGHVTFGSFNNFAKVTPRVLAAWARVLSAVRKSRLVLLASTTESVRSYVKQSFDDHGIDSSRIDFFQRRPRRGYLELISQVDIALDPFPMNGHTTTCDALWQGVPVITLSGGTYASRFGASGLATLGLGELIANSCERYVEIAAGLAADVDRLQELRAGLRRRMSDSPLLDHAGFTRNLEAAYRQMWTDWCAGRSK